MASLDYLSLLSVHSGPPTNMTTFEQLFYVSCNFDERRHQRMDRLDSDGVHSSNRQKALETNDMSFHSLRRLVNETITQ